MRGEKRVRWRRGRSLWHEERGRVEWKGGGGGDTSL